MLADLLRIICICMLVWLLGRSCCMVLELQLVWRLNACLFRTNMQLLWLTHYCGFEQFSWSLMRLQYLWVVN